MRHILRYLIGIAFMSAVVLNIGVLLNPLLHENKDVEIKSRVAIESNFQTKLLKLHNDERVKTKRKFQFVWNTELADSAQRYAQKLADNKLFEHSHLPDVGENLFKGTSGKFQLEDMFGFWLSEKVFYQSGVFPRVSKTGNWEHVGHYTQIIWDYSQQPKLGCGLAFGQGYTYLVCHYKPQGNIRGTLMFPI